jgi:urease accessory protein
MTSAAPAQSRAELFAANRAHGCIALSVAAERGRTVRRRVHESGSLRVRFPNSEKNLEAVIVNTGGGMTGGDRFSVSIALEEGATLVAGTAAAEKIYRSLQSDAEVDVRLSIGSGARLVWLPQDTILFDAARLKRSIDVDIAEGGSVLLAEAVVFGRTAMGEGVREGAWRDRWRVRLGERLAFAENVRLDGAIAEKLQRKAIAAGACAIATLLMVPSDQALVEAVRAMSFAGEAGMSAWNGIAVARFCASDGASLRKDMVAVLSVLGQPVPRLWLQ